MFQQTDRKIRADFSFANSVLLRYRRNYYGNFYSVSALSDLRRLIFTGLRHQCPDSIGPGIFWIKLGLDVTRTADSGSDERLISFPTMQGLRFYQNSPFGENISNFPLFPTRLQTTVTSRLM